MEEWRDILGYDGLYQVSNMGKVRRMAVGNNTYPGKILKPVLQNRHSGHRFYAVLLSNNAVRKWHSVHRLVWETFIGKIPKNTHVLFKNGNELDCRLDNLYHRESERRIKRAARHRQGLSGQGVKYPQSMIDEIRNAPRAVKNVELAKQYGMHESNVSRIRRGLVRNRDDV